jgi:uncharacterized membrane-anchored protein YjiN (DUF445 family)
MHGDLHRVISVFASVLRYWLTDMGKRRNESAEIQEWINTQYKRAAPPLIEECREKIGIVISDQVKTWDEQYMVERIELNSELICNLFGLAGLWWVDWWD